MPLIPLIHPRVLPLVAGAVALLLHVTPVDAQPTYDTLRLIAPAAPGGGWDQTARAMQQVLQRIGVAQAAPVENIPGAAGTIGLARFISAERGRGDTLMLSGLIMQAAVITHQSPVTLREVTPIARLVGEYEVVVVPTASPFRTLADLIAAFKERPESISWGGGSAGGTDQILAGLIAEAAGVTPTRVNYIAFSGGGEVLSSLLGQQLSAGVNGYGEMQPQVEAGALRVLGISSAERIPGIDAHTLREQGIDVELVNWRSVVAPPGISLVDRRRLVSAVEVMARSPEWHALLDRYHWIDNFLTGRDLEQFMDAEDARVRSILNKLGTGGDAGSTRRTTGTYPFLILLGLAVTGIAAMRDLLRLRAPRFGGQVRTPRTSVANGEPTPWRPVALIATGMALEVLLLERAGFVLASAVLFWFVARAFDTRRPLRDAVFALSTAIASYLLFVRLLKLSLPAGWLGTWM